MNKLHWLCVGVLLVCGSAFGQTYNFGKSSTVIVGLGRDGTLTGQLDLFNGFIKRPGQQLQIVKHPGSIATSVVQATKDCILGSFTSFSGDNVGFLDCKGQPEILYQFGTTFPTGRRADGTAVGYYSTNGGAVWSGFIQKGTQSMHPYMAPNSTSTQIFFTTQTGWIGGQFTDSHGAQHGFIDNDPGGFQQIDARHAGSTAVTGSNAHCLVGWYTTPNGQTQYGFTRCGQAPKDDVTFAVGRGTYPKATTPDGSIAGFFYNETLKTYSGFVLKQFAN